MNWQPLYDSAIYGLLVAVVVVLLVAARRLAVSDKARSLVSLGARATVFGILMLLLVNPVDIRQTQLPPEPPTVAMLVDCSQSMALGSSETRLAAAKRAIAEATRRTQTQPPPNVELYRFGRRLANVPSLAEMSATEDASELASALQHLPSRLAGKNAQAVILFSDGAVKDSDSLGGIATAFGDNQLPIHVFQRGEESIRGDVAITQLQIPQTIRAGEKITARAVVHCRGFDGERVMVSVKPLGETQTSPLATLPVTLSEGDNPVEFVLFPDSIDGQLVIDVPDLPGEATTTNNRVPFRLSGRDGRLKVLYMEGTQNQEYRWLRDALEEDPKICCTTMVVNDQYSQRPTLQRVDDPYRGYPTTRAELFEYDVVICSDIPQGAFTPEQIEWTVELVARRGGGFAMVGGHTSFGSGGWDRTPWEKLIPFDMTGRRDYLGQWFSVEIPPAAESHPIWKLLDDPDKNRAALQSMPRFSGTNLISRLKPAATLLGRTSSSLPRVGVMPVFASETYGRGRTFAMSTDTTVSWGRMFESSWGEGDNRYYRKFWRNVIGWLSENSFASQQRLIIKTDQVVYSPGQPIELSVEAFDNQLNATLDYELTASISAMTDETEGTRNIAAAPVSGTSNEHDADAKGVGTAEMLEANQTLQRYIGTFTAALPAVQQDASTPMQPARISVTARSGDKVVATGSVAIQLINHSDEWLDPQVRPDVLSSLVQSSGGNLLRTSSQIAQQLGSLKASEGKVLTYQLPLWDRPVVWSLLLALLALDWILRRRPNAEQPST